MDSVLRRSAWFDGLERDNSRDYFTRTRDLYEREVRGQLEDAAAGARFGGEVKVFRQHRDLRFSADKRPYKERTYGVRGRAITCSSPRAASTPAPATTASSRDQLERYPGGGRGRRDRARAGGGAGGARGSTSSGASLKTAPRGYPRDHPRIELLRHKQLIVGKRCCPRGGIPRDRRSRLPGGADGLGAAVLAWLDEHVGPTTPEQRGRYGSG